MRDTTRAARLVTHRGPLSCITTRKTSHGRYIDENCFDVPAEGYGVGWQRGRRLAIEILDDLGRSRLIYGGSRFLDVVIAASAATADEGEVSRRGAAVGLLRTLESLLQAVSRGEGWRAFIESQIAATDAWERKDRARKAAEGQAFARRMEIAKAAKARASREVRP
jgi:hypothetical protein